MSYLTRVIKILILLRHLLLVLNGSEERLLQLSVPDVRAGRADQHL